MSGFCSLLNCRPLISFGLNIVQYKQNFTCLISISSIDYSTSMHTSTTPQETCQGLPKVKSQKTGMSLPLPPLKGGKFLNQILSHSRLYYRGKWWSWQSWTLWVDTLTTMYFPRRGKHNVTVPSGRPSRSHEDLWTENTSVLCSLTLIGLNSYLPSK